MARGAPKQVEVARKLVALDALLFAFSGTAAVIDVCRLVAQVELRFFSGRGAISYDDLLRKVAIGRLALSEQAWARADAIARRQAEKAFPADERGVRSPSAQRRFDARVRTLRAAELRRSFVFSSREMRLVDAAASALKEAHYARSAAESGCGADAVMVASAAVDSFAPPWALG